MSSKDKHLNDCFALIRVLGSIISRQEYRKFIQSASAKTIRRIAICLNNIWQEEIDKLPIQLQNKLKRHRLRIQRICDPANSKEDKVKALVNAYQLICDLHTVISWLSGISF